MENNFKIGDILKQDGYITEAQLERTLEYQKQHKGKKLGEILIELGVINEKQMLSALAKRLNYRHIDIENAQVDMDAIPLIPKQLAEKNCMLAIKQENGTLTLAVNDPMDLYAIEEVKQLTGMQVDIAISEKAPLLEAIRYYYYEIDALEAAKKANISAGPEVEEITIDETDAETPTINLLNSLVLRAYSTNSSDIHIEPFETKTTVRMRIDGIIIDYATLKKNVHAPLIARIKILSDLDIAEKRVPQDGHFKMTVENESLNVRVSLIPTVFGEKAVLRLLSNNSKIDYAASYGMREENYAKFIRMLSSPNGIIYLTGPTGCGKTTTLYMAMEELAKKQVNISTIEDPVEKNLNRINQMQVNNVAGLTFESGLRAMLRQDPDIIMVGETRDAETASISVRAAITGHLVLSTLHTNDAASSVNRLKDMGLEAYMVSSSLIGVVAQRLMRKVCPDCCEDEELTDEERAFLGRDIKTVKKAKGCRACNYTGYKGRIAIHEILFIDKALRSMIISDISSDDIKAYAIEHQHMITLKEGGTDLIEAGLTTMDELYKIAYAE